MIEVEAIGELEAQLCKCCGTQMFVAKGWLAEGERDIGTYKVEWTPGQLEHESGIDLILGDWHETGGAADRFAVSVVHRLHEGRPQFLIIDAAEKFALQSDTHGSTMSPDALSELGMTPKIYVYVEQIVLQDSRLHELTGGWGPEAKH